MIEQVQIEFINHLDSILIIVIMFDFYFPAEKSPSANMAEQNTFMGGSVLLKSTSAGGVQGCSQDHLKYIRVRAKVRYLHV